ncbi:MAG: hypothetical protein Rhob2KO_01850 [Rhodopirellula baltica]|uniref:Uncharacterized protein n=1 Tax=Rhodopirellula baltica SWK14 TaxID=993516 RepID=L7CBI7_RHOBT|nr:hypothetical protein RBSWK_04470 [Rhodopirellula baltica SWK14]
MLGFLQLARHGVAPEETVVRNWMVFENPLFGGFKDKVSLPDLTDRLMDKATSGQIGLTC